MPSITSLTTSTGDPVTTLVERLMVSIWRSKVRGRHRGLCVCVLINSTFIPCLPNNSESLTILHCILINFLK